MQIPAAKLDELRARLQSYQPNHETNKDEYYSYWACVEAYESLTEGNFGIGGLLVDPEGNIVARGHNRMFKPYFRSDLHCEMVIMNSFEDRHPDVQVMKHYRLYTSLEPCTMCTARLIFSGVESVVYVADDTFGGMIGSLSKLPPAWLALTKGRQVFRTAECSDELRSLALDLCMANAKELYAALGQR